MDYAKLNDEQLVKLYIEGNRESLTYLIDKYKQKVFSYIMVQVKNESVAEDIFQETFIKVIKSLKAGKYKEDGRFIGWVMRIAHNLLIDFFRKENQMSYVQSDEEKTPILNNLPEESRTEEEKVIGRQLRKQLKGLIYNLPFEQREVLLLRFFIGLSFKDIAEQTGVSINTALGRMRYATINLRKMIEENGNAINLNDYLLAYNN